MVVDGSRSRAITDTAACVAMVAMEGCIIVLTIMASTAMGRGMNPFVFVVYTNALSSFLLIPFAFLPGRKNRLEEEVVLRWAVVWRVLLLGTIGVTVGQTAAYVGLSMSSPIVACGMANQIPAFSFILGLILRTTKFDWKRSGSQARLLGTLISLMGATSLTLYRGPTIAHSSPSLAIRGVVGNQARLFLHFTSPHENWILGCCLFAASSLALTIWNILQVGAAKLCPQVMKIVCCYSLFGSIQSAAVALFLQWDDLSVWKLGDNFQLLVIILTAIFSSLIRSSVQIWCGQLKGPYFVALFKPFGIPFASMFGSLLFADTFHYGSMMGAFICGAGYYTVLWGQIKDKETNKLGQDEGKISPIDDERVPLLLESDSQV